MTSATAFGSIEDDRLDAHFEWVLCLLRGQPIDALGPLSRAARDRSLALLEDYARRARFPRNTVHSNRMVPVFVDDIGSPCAVAHLLTETGEHHLVETIHRTLNTSYVKDMLDPALSDWIARAGLTVAEAALIQPEYCGPPDPTGCTVTSNPCGPKFDGAGCQCVKTNVEDGWPCEGQGSCPLTVCVAGSCVDFVDTCAKPPNATIKRTCDEMSDCVDQIQDTRSSSCSDSPVPFGVPAGAPAALLAAVFLGALVRRRRRPPLNPSEGRRPAGRQAAWRHNPCD